MPKNNKKNRKSIKLKPLFCILAIVIPVASYVFFVFKHTNLFMLNPSGYFYIWFWDILSSGKILRLQSTIPRPLLVFFYGLLATPSLFWIEALKMFLMIGLGYGIYELSHRVTESYLLAVFTEVLVFTIPLAIKNIAFGTDSFVATTFIIWAIYFYIEEHYALVSLLLLLAGLIRPEAWLLNIFLIIHSFIASKKFRMPLLIGLLSPFLWITFDFFLTKDPFYSFKVLNHYFTVTSTPVLSFKEIINSYYTTFLSNSSIYLIIILLLSILFSLLKRQYETILLVTASSVIFLIVSCISVFTGFYRESYILLPLILFVTLIPFFLKSIFSFTSEVIPYLLFAGLIGINDYSLKRKYKDMINCFLIEKNKQEACRQMAPQVSVIDDKIVLMPYQRIGMFAYLNRKAYTNNILSERDMIARGLSLSDLNYVVFITNDFDKSAERILAPILQNKEQNDIIRTGNAIIQSLYTTPNGLGKIFKIFVLKESEQGQIDRAKPQ